MTIPAYVFFIVGAVGILGGLLILVRGNDQRNGYNDWCSTDQGQAHLQRRWERQRAAKRSRSFFNEDGSSKPYGSLPGERY